MFPETYGFSAQFTVEFWIDKVQFKNPLIQLAMRSVEDAFDQLGWKYGSSLDKKWVGGSAEPVKESKFDNFWRFKVAPILEPGTLTSMRMMPDRISWNFVDAGSKVIAKVEFYTRKTTFFNRPEKDRLSSIIRRLFERVQHHSQKYFLGTSFARIDEGS